MGTTMSVELSSLTEMIKRRDIKTKDLEESLHINEIQEAMFAEIEAAKKIRHATFDKLSNTWLVDEYIPMNHDFDKGKQIAKTGVIAFKSLIWADNMIRNLGETERMDNTLKKFSPIIGGWRIQFSENDYMEVEYE